MSEFAPSYSQIITSSLDHRVFLYGHNWHYCWLIGTKQTTGIEGGQCRLARIQRNHIACAMLVWVRLKQIAQESPATIYQLKQGLLGPSPGWRGMSCVKHLYQSDRGNCQVVASIAGIYDKISGCR